MGMRHILAVTIMLALGIALGGGGALAGWDEGMGAYERGNYEIALREYQSLAE